jgi:hypothetical protein
MATTRRVRATIAPPVHGSATRIDISSGIRGTIPERWRAPSEPVSDTDTGIRAT